MIVIFKEKEYNLIFLNEADSFLSTLKKCTDTSLNGEGQQVLPLHTHNELNNECEEAYDEGYNEGINNPSC